MKKFVLSTIASLVLATSAHANLVSQDFNVVPNTTPVHYLNFNVTTAGTFSLDAFGFDSLGSGFDADTVLHLFKTSLTLGNHLGYDDDSGIGADAHLNLNLSVGNYILAVGDYYFDATGAINGVGGSVEAPGGLIRAQVSSSNGVASLQSVPEPESLALFGAALAGLGLTRRKAKQA